MTLNQPTTTGQRLHCFLQCLCFTCAFRFLLVFPLVMGLSACLIPYGYEQGEERLFVNEGLAFIEVGKSTKQEVEEGIIAIERREEIRLPREKFRNGDWWLYTQSREETKLNIAFIAPYDGGVTRYGGIDYSFLLIKFDRQGVVAGYELSYLEQGLTGCNQQGICKGKDRHYVLATEAEDRAVKQTPTPADRCGIYVYSVLNHRRSYLLHEPQFWVDNQHAGWLMDEKQFLYVQVDQGPHQIFTNLASNYSSVLRKQLNFYCKGGESYYFEIVRPTKYKFEFEQQSLKNGKVDIMTRRLILPGCFPTWSNSNVCD